MITALQWAVFEEIGWTRQWDRQTDSAVATCLRPWGGWWHNNVYSLPASEVLFVHATQRAQYLLSHFCPSDTVFDCAKTTLRMRTKLSGSDCSVLPYVLTSIESHISLVKWQHFQWLWMIPIRGFKFVSYSLSVTADFLVYYTHRMYVLSKVLRLVYIMCFRW